MNNLTPMKTTKMILAAVCFFMLGASCKKQGGSPANSTSPGVLYGTTLPADATPEMKRVYNLLQRSDNEVMIIDNTNFHSPGQYDVMISGRTEPADKISIQIDDDVYSSRADGQWLTQVEIFRKYYGRNVQIKIRSGDKTLNEAKLYIPKPQLAEVLEYSTESMSYKRPAVLKWTPDENEATKKIFLRYMLFDSENRIIKQGVKIIDNSGVYNIDDLLDTKGLEEINLTLMSGNWMSATIKGKTILFGIATHNHHAYFMQNKK
jgi:hypothetical protein